MSFITRGFTGAGRERDPRLPPGQSLVADWPVLSAGPTPEIDTADWSFSIRTETGALHQWSWDELLALGVDDITVDIHCVTHWTKLDMPWRGVSLDKLFENVETSADYVMARGSRPRRRANRSTPSTADRPGCSCPRGTSGRAPSGCAASS